LVHFLWYDFEQIEREVDLKHVMRNVSSPLSLNAMFIASTLLASRIERIMDVYFILFQSIVIFGYFPIVRQYFKVQPLYQWHKEKTPNGIRSMATCHFVCQFLFLIKTLASCCVFFSRTVLFPNITFPSEIFIALISPLIFIYFYQYKK